SAPFIASRRMPGQALEVTGFCHRFQHRSAAFSSSGAKRHTNCPYPMHIALARPLLPPGQVMHCCAWDRGGSMAVAFDEMNGPGGDLRPAYRELSRWLKETPPDALEYRRQEAELLFRRIGITFAVYGDAEAQERLIPFDVIPRIISAREWALLEKGL